MSPPAVRRRRVLVLDVGGTSVKLRVGGDARRCSIRSGPTMSPRRLVRGVLAAAADWSFDVVSIGYPGPVREGRPAKEPRNLGPGWLEFDFDRALGVPVRLVNDAAMQALGSYRGGTMLFLGLGTGLGTAIVAAGVVVPMELAHLPCREGRTFEDDLGAKGLARLGLAGWKRAVGDVVAALSAVFLPDDIVIGGGNVHRLAVLPRGARRGSNDNAFLGGVALWNDAGTLESRTRKEAACSDRAGSR